MKKIIMLFITLIFLSSCYYNNKNNETDRIYFDLLDITRNNDKFKFKSDSIDIKLDIENLNDEYRYDISFDNSKIAMYRLKAIAIFEDESNKEIMVLSFGIFDNKTYSLIPNQFHLENGYIKGFIMSGVNDEKIYKVKILLQWQNFDNSEIFKEFIILNGENNE